MTTSTKAPGETVNFGYDFTSRLGDSAISSVVSVAQVAQHGLGSLGGGSFTIQGSQVVVTWSGGISGEQYLTTVTVQTTGSETLESVGLITVDAGVVADTSGLTSGLMSAGDMITAAMQELGILSAGETPDGDDTILGLRVLNWMLKSFAARGVNLWREEQGSVAFPAGVATIQLDPFCLDIMEARLVQSSTFERPLQRWEGGQYRQIPNKGQRGYPTAFYVAKQTNSLTLTLWPVPSTDSTVLYTYSRVTQDVTDAAQNLDIPQEWTETVYLALASRLASTFGVTRIDPNTVKLVAQRAAAYEQLLLDQDRPSSVFMGSAYDRNF